MATNPLTIAAFRGPQFDDTGHMVASSSGGVSGVFVELLQEQAARLFHFKGNSFNLTTWDSNRDRFQSIPLRTFSEDTIKGFYTHANGVICATMHGTYSQWGDKIGTPGSGEAYYASYDQVQREVAEAIAGTGPRGPVMVNDFQFCRVPEWLLTYGIESSFFLHGPFLNEAMGIFIPPMQGAVKGFLAAKRVAVHRRWYLEELGKFVVEHLPGYTANMQALTVTSPRGLQTQLVASAIGINGKRWIVMLAKRAPLPERLETLVRSKKKILLAVGRMDPSKGGEFILAGFENFLQRCPAEASNCVLVVVSAASREVLQAFSDTRQSIVNKVSASNDRWPDQVMLVDEPLNQEQLARLYGRADVMILPTVIDGLGQTAQEYAFCNNHGAIVVTLGTGVIAQIEENVVVCRTERASQMAMAINMALSMSGTDAARQHLEVIRRKTPTVEGWLADVTFPATTTAEVVSLDSSRNGETAA